MQSNVNNCKFTRSASTLITMTNFLCQWDVLKDCPDLPNHRITKFAIRKEGAWLVNDQGRLLVYGKNDDKTLGLGHSYQVYAKLAQVETLRDKKIVDLTFGGDFVVALTGDGQVWTWGKTNRDCVLGEQNRIEPGLPRLLCTDIVSIKCGFRHSLALSKSGKLWTWGANHTGQIGNGEKLLGGSAPLTGLETEFVTKIACGANHSLALTKYGKLFAWGCNIHANLGFADRGDSPTPVQVTTFPQCRPIQDIACGDYHSLVLLGNGQNIYAMGNNQNGALGHPDIEYWSPVPVKVNTNYAFRSILCAGKFSAAMAMDGSVHVWGEVNQVVTREVMKTPCKSFAQALLFYHSSTFTPRNMLVDNIEPVNPHNSKLDTLFNDSATSDIEFVVEHQSIHAHRNYLSFMSPYLAGMLSEHWEASKKQVTITQYSYPTFRAYIRYLYTGLVHFKYMILDNVVDLLDLATAFVEEPLRRSCSKALQETWLCSPLACNLFRVADRYDLDELKHSVVRYVRNHMGGVTSSESFKNMNPERRKKLLTSVEQLEWFPID